MWKLQEKLMQKNSDHNWLYYRFGWDVKIVNGFIAKETLLNVIYFKVFKSWKIRRPRNEEWKQFIFCQSITNINQHTLYFILLLFHNVTIGSIVVYWRRVWIIVINMFRLRHPANQSKDQLSAQEQYRYERKDDDCWESELWTNLVRKHKEWLQTEFIQSIISCHRLSLMLRDRSLNMKRGRLKGKLVLKSQWIRDRVCWLMVVVVWERERESVLICRFFVVLFSMIWMLCNCWCWTTPSEQWTRSLSLWLN